MRHGLPKAIIPKGKKTNKQNTNNKFQSEKHCIKNKSTEYTNVPVSDFHLNCKALQFREATLHGLDNVF